MFVIIQNTPLIFRRNNSVSDGAQLTDTTTAAFINGAFDTNDIHAASLTMLISEQYFEGKESLSLTCKVGFLSKLNDLENIRRELIISKEGRVVFC